MEHLENYSTPVERSFMFCQPFLHFTLNWGDWRWIYERENIKKKYLRNYKLAKLRVFKYDKKILFAYYGIKLELIVQKEIKIAENSIYSKISLQCCLF